jgi:hypothetical protein
MMRLRLLTALAVVALAVVSGAFAADAGRAPNKPPPAVEPLSPLSEADTERSHQTGCNFVFGAADKDYIQLIADELMFRTGSGLQVCHITNADAFMETKGAAAVCDGVSLKLRSTGRTRQYPASDSSAGPARLTIGQGRASWVMRGHWSVAC